MNIRTSAALLSTLALAIGACKQRSYSEPKSETSNYGLEARGFIYKYANHDAPNQEKKAQRLVALIKFVSNGKYDLTKNVAEIPTELASRVDKSGLEADVTLVREHLYHLISLARSSEAAAEAIVCDKRYSGKLAPAKISFSSEPEHVEPEPFDESYRAFRSMVVVKHQFEYIVETTEKASGVLHDLIAQRCWNDTTGKVDDCNAPDEKKCGKRLL